MEKEKPLVDVVPSKEKEPEPLVALLYRGENAFMRSLVSLLANQGFKVHSEEISIDENRDSTYKERETRIRAEIQEALSRIEQISKNNLFIVDNSIRYTLRDDYKTRAIYNMLEKGKGIFAYEFLDAFEPDKYLGFINVYVQELEKQSRSPVVLTFGLSHHFDSGFSLDGTISDEEKNKIKETEQKLLKNVGSGGYDSKEDKKKSAHIAAILGTKFNVPVISQAEFDPRSNKISSLPKILEKMGIPSDKATLLVDHHIYEVRKESEVKKSGLDSLEVLPICMCDMLDDIYLSKLKNQFNVSNVREADSTKEKLQEIDDGIYQRIVSGITQRLREIIETNQS